MPVCAKCPDPARAVMGFSYADRLVWLGDLGAGADPFTTYLLCPRHADRFVAPWGWSLDDRRRRLEQPMLVAGVA